MDYESVATVEVTQLSDDVPRAYHPILSMWIPFSTHADAKLAQLAWDHDIPMHTINHMLGLFRDPLFSSAEVTFNRAVDIDLRIANFKADLAHHRSAPTIPGVLGRMHRDVLEMIIHEVAGLDWDGDLLFTPYDQLDLYNENHEKGELNTPRRLEERMRDLKSLSLVHRSWTSLAQKYLGRDLVIKGAKDLSLSYNPMFGPWTCRITLSLDDLPHDDPSLCNQVETIETMLVRASNLRTLFFKPPAVGEEGSARTLAVARLIDVVGGELHSLERLFWVAKPSPHGYSHFAELYAAIAQIPSLKLLSLSGIGCHEVDKYRALPSACVDSLTTPHIKELFLSDLPDIVPINLLRWLVNPAPGVTITQLTIDPTKIMRPQNLGEVISALEPALPFLQSLWIISNTGFTWDGDQEGIGQLLTKCTTLRRLGLACMRANVLLNFMPSMLEEIDVISTYASMRNHMEQDSQFYRYLCNSEHPRLRRFTWTIPDRRGQLHGLPHSYEEEHVTTLPLMMAREVCAEEGIEFAVNIRVLPPPSAD